jgi:hypothetical protein
MIDASPILSHSILTVAFKKKYHWLLGDTATSYLIHTGHGVTGS